MKYLIYTLLCLIPFVPAAGAQLELVTDSFFPADLEFPELRQTSEVVFEDPARLAKLDYGRLWGDVGFEKYAQRVYEVSKTGTLSIEIVSLKDYRAAYSLLTLLRDSNLRDGPPGDAYTAAADGIRFAKRRDWIRMRASGVPEDLLKRVAGSVSNRLGPEKQEIPSLISHLPRPGYDASSLRYFPGLESFENFAGSKAGAFLKFQSDVEIAQARYSLGTRSGVLSLLNFPTPQVAEDCYADLTANGARYASAAGGAIYTKRVGPIVAALEGSFDPAAANTILDPIQFRYSVRWIYEKSSSPATIWGVPAGILGTVVRSLFFVVLLCGVSIVAGAAFAFFRFALRGRSSDNILDRQSEITRLRLR